MYKCAFPLPWTESTRTPLVTMPRQPLVDLSSLDLEAEQYDRAFIETINAQRHEMFQLTGIIQHVPEDGLTVGYRAIEDGEWWARGHIPGRPLFPGVLMIEAAAQLCTFDYMMRAPSRDFFFGFGGVNRVRFRDAITPPARLVIVSKQLAIRSRMGTWETQGFVDGKMVFEAEVMGVIV